MILGYIGLVKEVTRDVTYITVTASPLAIFGACNFGKEDDKPGVNPDPCEFLS